MQSILTITLKHCYNKVSLQQEYKHLCSSNAGILTTRIHSHTYLQQNCQHLNDMNVSNFHIKDRGSSLLEEVCWIKSFGKYGGARAGACCLLSRLCRLALVNRVICDRIFFGMSCSHSTVHVKTQEISACLLFFLSVSQVLPIRGTEKQGLEWVTILPQGLRGTPHM